MANQQVKFVFEGDTSDLEKALSTVSRKFDQAKKESKELAKDVSIFGRDFDRQAEKIGKFMSVNAKAFGAIGAGIGTVVLGFAAVAKAAEAAVKVVTTLTNETLAMAEAGDEVAKAAKRVGTTAEELQAVRFAFAEGGVAAEQADAAMLKLNLRLAQVAETGKGPAADALKKIGLSAQELSDLPLPERVALFADKFSGLASAGEQVVVANALMEEGGQRLISALAGGGDVIRESAAALESLGMISNEAAAQSEILIDAQGRLDQALRGLRFDVLAPLLPVLTGVARGITKLLATLDSKEVEDFGEAMQQMAFMAVDALAAIGAGAEIALASLKPALLSAIGAVQAARGDLAGAALSAASALKEAVELPGVFERAGRRWASYADTIKTEMDQAVRTSKKAAEEIRKNLGEVGGAGGAGDGVPGEDGGITFGEGTGVVGMEDDAISGAVVSITDDLQFMAEQAEERLNEVNDTVGEVARNIKDLFGSIGSNITDSIRENEKKISELHERFISSRNGMEKIAIQEQIRGLERKVEAEKEAAVAVFNMQKALGIAEAGIRPAVAVAAALAQPPGPPATIPFGILAGVLGGAQIAAIAAEPPPSFHAGGMVAQAAPDEINARLLRTEAVLSPQGVNAVGGEEGVRQLNRGAGGVGQPIVSVLQVRSRTVDAMISDNLRTKQGPLVDALRAARPRALGRHNPFASS